ncbi:MAG: hypothetical protein JJE40_20230 [Vicinamibacteria bacterium]|nr:hypothetical protein [Vicinamibacteria bacterium]
MRIIIKLAIAALVIHAAYQVGSAYWDHYQFTDAVQQVAQFGEREPIPEIKKRVMELAAERHLPIAEDAISVTRLQRRIDVDGVYTRDILLAPGYKRPWTFTVDVVVLTLN